MKPLYGGALMVLVGALFLVAPPASAQELYQEEKEIVRAVVEDVLSTRTDEEGFGVLNPVQVLSARILEGARAGERVRIENDYGPLATGDAIFVTRVVHVGGEEYFTVFERNRVRTIGFLVALFVGAVVYFGGMQGVRALLSLCGGLLAIVYLLLPSLVAGYPPVTTALLVATAILATAIFFTHGFSKGSLVAFLGTVLAVSCTGVFAALSVWWAGFTGFSSDDAVYLNLSTAGTLDVSGLLLAGIIIGVIGVLDDIAVTQVAVVRELYGAHAHIAAREVYARAMRVGREHAGALVNTLVLAYTGAALPLLLLFSLSDSTFLFTVNREVFAVEIVRAIAGSLGLLLTVPITTALAVWFLRGEKDGPGHVHH